MVNLILLDQEFDKLEGKLDLIEINTTTAREHVGEIERSICTIKERVREITTVMPYKVFPKQVVVHLVYYVTTLLNCSISNLGFLKKFSVQTGEEM